MKKLLVFTALFLICCGTVMAQKPNIDSLQKAYNKNWQDTTLVQLYFLKSMYTFLTTNVDSGMMYSRKALELSQKIHFRKGVVRALSGIATFQNLSGDLPG